MEKRAPLGICDCCGGQIPADLGPYTTKGRPRMYCCVECRNTANSRHGAPVRSQKAKQRVAQGQWQNPSPALRGDAEAIRQWHEHFTAGLSNERKHEVREGRWRNPALDMKARQKLSRPRKHGGVLHTAMEKLRAGARMCELLIEEQEAYRAYRRALSAAKRKKP